MSDTYRYAAVLLACAVAGLLALSAGRLTERIRVPAPLLVLAAAAVAVRLVDPLHHPSETLVEHVVTVALVYVLFDGGMSIGRRRFASASAPIAVVGVLGTFLTAALTAVLVHYALDLDWFRSLLVATAVAPTDPAVVFSVLGRHEIAGRSGTILEGESGANDPVGIALMASLISAGELSGHALGDVVVQFLLQMLVGGAIGVGGGYGILWIIRRLPLPARSLYPLRTAAYALALFGIATVAHGSGFLAVFVAGILIGDEDLPQREDTRQFHSALAGLGEIVTFCVLGLTIDLDVLARTDVWAPGLLIGVVLAVVVRPIAVGLSLLGSKLGRAEQLFVYFAGLKGAVPILLGGSLLTAHIADSQRLYGIVVVVVVFSVLVQGGLVPTVAAALRLPMTLRED